MASLLGLSVFQWGCQLCPLASYRAREDLILHSRLLFALLERLVCTAVFLYVESCMNCCFMAETYKCEPDKLVLPLLLRKMYLFFYWAVRFSYTFARKRAVYIFIFKNYCYLF